MFERFAAGLLAVALVTASGMTDSVAYLCLMDGKVRLACCCAENRAAVGDAVASAAEADRCCEVRVTSVDPLRQIGAARLDLRPMPLSAALASVAQVQGPATQEAALPPAPRGPPSANGPPIFLRNCSYII